MSEIVSAVSLANAAVDLTQELDRLRAIVESLKAQRTPSDSVRACSSLKDQKLVADAATTLPLGGQARRTSKERSRDKDCLSGNLATSKDQVPSWTSSPEETKTKSKRVARPSWTVSRDSVSLEPIPSWAFSSREMYPGSFVCPAQLAPAHLLSRQVSSLLTSQQPSQRTGRATCPTPQLPSENSLQHFSDVHSGTPLPNKHKTPDVAETEDGNCSTASKPWARPVAEERPAVVRKPWVDLTKPYHEVELVSVLAKPSLSQVLAMKMHQARLCLRKLGGMTFGFCVRSPAAI